MGSRRLAYKSKKRKVCQENLEKGRQIKRQKKELQSAQQQELKINDITQYKEEINQVENKETLKKSFEDGECKNVSQEHTDFIIEKEIPFSDDLLVQGRRIVDLQFFINQIYTLSNHNKIIKEINYGLHSYFKMKCNMCNTKFKLHTSDRSGTEMCVNDGAVIGAMMTGCGQSNLDELLASVDLPIIGQRIYAKCHDKIASWWEETAEASMVEAAKKEAEKAISCGHVKDGIPIVKVIADCCWSKRSYRSNYSAASGVAAIIGYKTGKVLHIAVKNKFCVICAKADAKNVTPVTHKCHKNHSGSSTSMEQSGIVEGFKTSIGRRNLIYGTLIADGDASTYKKILESRPYPNVQVEKIECTNHLLRNYNGKIINLTKDTSIPLAERKLLTVDRINRLRTSIRSAARFRNAQNLNPSERIISLKKDIMNSPRHVLGDHSVCDAYYCTEERKKEENLVPKVKTLFKKLIDHATHIALHSKSLLYNLNNNRAEQFNSIVAKHVGGKRVNYSLKNSYTARCDAAVVSFNTAQPQYVLYKSKFYKSPGRALKRIEMARKKRQLKEKTRRNPKRKLMYDVDKSCYGEECERPDMPNEEYETAKEMFLKNLQEQVNNRQEVERDTVLQAESALWLELRRSLLTASSFSKVCKRRTNISPAPLVKSLLYTYSLEHVPSIQHGKNNEKIAIEQLQIQEKITIQKCGLFVDEKLFYLGATPDGLIEDGVVEIKCPSSAFDMDPDEAINRKKIKFWNVNGTVNQRHDWYYQIQGQLHVTKRNVCLFAVWTGKQFFMKTARILRDDKFWKENMETRLINFYNKCILPEIVDPRKSRSMKLRDDRY